MHSECLTGDAFGSWRCDCGEQLDAALSTVAAAGEGAVIYVRGHEGRGIGLLEKLRAYALQDLGADTVDANVALGHSADARSYDQSAAILRDLGIERIRLLSSNPAKAEALTELGAVLQTIKDRAFLVTGHTDNVPISASRFKSNWELSTARAVNVVQYPVPSGRRCLQLGEAILEPSIAEETPNDRTKQPR